MSTKGILTTVLATQIQQALIADGTWSTGQQFGTHMTALIREVGGLLDDAPLKPNPCAGIPRPGCDYLAACGTVCNKCGEVHKSSALIGMSHDYRILQQFHTKHALGAKAAPSCFCCGQQTHPITRPIAVQHMELPAVVVCSVCRDAATKPVQWGAATTAGQLIAQLSTFPADMPIHGVFHSEIDGKRQPLIRPGVTLSREHVEGRKIGGRDDLNTLVIWSAPMEPT